MTNDGTNADAELVINPFNAVEEQNDYEVCTAGAAHIIHRRKLTTRSDTLAAP